MPETKTHPYAPSTKTECDYLNGWIKKKKTIMYAKISPKMVHPRGIAGNAEEKEKEEEEEGDRQWKWLSRPVS